MPKTSQPAQQTTQNSNPINEVVPEEPTNQNELIHPKEQHTNHQIVDNKPTSATKKVPQKRASSLSLHQISNHIEEKKQEQKKKQEAIQEVAQQQTKLNLNEAMQQSVYNAWYNLEQVYQKEGVTTLETAIKQSTIHYQNNTVEVTVLGEIAKSMLEERYAFIVDFIKEQTNLPQFNFQITATEVNTQNVITYTKEEQLQYLMESNPAIANLVQAFRLEIDYNNNNR